MVLLRLSLLMKVPAGTRCLGVLACSLVALDRRRFAFGFGDIVVLAPGVAIFVLVRRQTRFNLHLRYALATLLFGCQWLSRVFGDERVGPATPSQGCITGNPPGWSTLSSLGRTPQSLMPFNDISGDSWASAWRLDNGNVNGGIHIVLGDRQRDAQGILAVRVSNDNPDTLGIWDEWTRRGDVSTVPPRKARSRVERSRDMRSRRIS